MQSAAVSLKTPLVLLNVFLRTFHDRAKAARISSLELLPLPSRLLRAYLQHLQCSRPREWSAEEPYGIHR